MHDLDLRAMRLRLLRGGVAPKHVRRALKELRHHFADLKRSAEAEGMSSAEATAQAVERLGDQQQIIDATLARPELRSWAHRWPWGVYGILPVVALALAIVVSISVCIGVLNLVKNLSGLDEAALGQALTEHSWARAIISAWLMGTAYVLPVAFAGLLCMFAGRRDAPLVWPAVGVFLILFLGFCFDLSFVPPQAPGELAEMRGGLGFATDNLINNRVLRLVVPLAAVLAPYYFWRRRHSDFLTG